MKNEGMRLEPGRSCFGVPTDEQCWVAFEKMSLWMCRHDDDVKSSSFELGFGRILYLNPVWSTDRLHDLPELHGSNGSSLQLNRLQRIYSGTELDFSDISQHSWFTGWQKEKTYRYHWKTCIWMEPFSACKTIMEPHNCFLKCINNCWWCFIGNKLCEGNLRLFSQGN